MTNCIRCISKLQLLGIRNICLIDAMDSASVTLRGLTFSTFANVEPYGALKGGVILQVDVYDCGQ